jgi:hypothetical protein
VNGKNDKPAHDLPEDLAGRLRQAVVAVLSHAIRRQHLPQTFTFDSELWDRLRDLGGSEACAAVTEEIERSQAVLRRAGVSRETDNEPGSKSENDLTTCD